MSTMDRVFQVTELYPGEGFDGVRVGTYQSLDAAGQGIALFILWRLALGTLDDWHPRQAPWGDVYLRKVEEWEGWDSDDVDWSAAENWIATHSLRELVSWFHESYPTARIRVEPIRITDQVPPATRLGAEQGEPYEYYADQAHDWYPQKDVLEEVLSHFDK